MSAPGAAPAPAGMTPAPRRSVLHHHVHQPSLELGALQGVHGGGSSFVFEFDKGKTARTARTIARDPQGTYLPKRREDGAQIAGGSLRGQITDVQGSQLPPSATGSVASSDIRRCAREPRAQDRMAKLGSSSGCCLANAAQSSRGSRRAGLPAVRRGPQRSFHTERRLQNTSVGQTSHSLRGCLPAPTCGRIDRKRSVSARS